MNTLTVHHHASAEPGSSARGAREAASGFGRLGRFRFEIGVAEVAVIGGDPAVDRNR